MMNQHAAGTLNQYPNLIELIGRHNELQGAAVWWGSAIGSDEVEPGLNPLPAVHDNILQDEINNGPTGHEAIGQDEVLPLSFEAIGQDEIQSPPILRLDRMSICNDEILLQDEAPDTAQ